MVLVLLIDRIGRRVKLRDLHVLLMVAQAGSMSKAAERLAVSHPVVSKTIADLEHALGGRLFDRTFKGVEPTQLGRAFLECGNAVFDDLRRGVRQMEFLSDPTAGELRIGATHPIMDGLILAAMESLTARYPRIEFHAMEGDSPGLWRALRERRVDLIVARIFRPTGQEEEFVCESLFEESLFVVAGLQSRWARRRKIALAELMNEHWVMPEHDNAVGTLIADGFRSIGMPLPKAQVVSNSMAVRTRLVTAGGFLTLLPGSMLKFGAKRLSVKALPVTLPTKSQPIEIVTLKNRSLSPVAKTFINCLHTIAKPLAKIAD
jgi:DNA-binding transcriptional LysR family regulator